MNRAGLGVFVLLALAGCQSVPEATRLAECKAEGNAKTCQQVEIEAVRDIRQDLHKIRQIREKRS